MEKRRKWSKEDIDFLENKWGVISTPALAKTLNRTITAVKWKAEKMELGNFFESGDFIVFNQLIKILGYKTDSGYLSTKFKKLGLTIKYKVSKKRKTKVVYIKDFWNWAEKNQKHLNFANFEKDALGEEPVWVDKKRKIDLNNPTKKNMKRKWTKEEDNLLIEKLKLYRYTYKDLAKEFDRTEFAIRSRIRKLNIKHRALYEDNQKKWTEEEVKKSLELYLKGYSIDFIAKKIDKSSAGIYEKIKKLNIKSTSIRG